MPLDTSQVPECTRCGTCCFSTTLDYLRVAGVDYDRLGDDAERLTHFLENRVYMRLIDGHCAALEVTAGGDFLCSVYERRPDVCRWLERGSGACLGERATKADRPQTALFELRTRRTATDPHPEPMKSHTRES